MAYASHAHSRIIPARAGFTGTILTCAPSAGDHPRSRGVYPSLMLKVLARKGSSPLARGLQAYFQAARNVGRIIPARAGFTTHHPSRKHTIPDHPRSRGVYESKTIKPRRHAGSSPLARGLPVDDNTLRRAFRIIPARAGFTKDKALRGAQNRDHPRSRGVYDDVPRGIQSTLGSSPLARGLPSESAPTVSLSRIIPARAGFTLADPWNPNDEPCYQTAFTFSANLEPAPPSSGSAVVLRRSTMTPSEA